MFYGILINIFNIADKNLITYLNFLSLRNLVLYVEEKHYNH